jgi:hypothetical protein
MTDTVFAVMAGSVDGDTDVLFRLYHKDTDAVNYITECMDTAWEEGYEGEFEEGIFRREVTVDSNGNPIAKITRRGEDIEWWRVEETAIY